MSYLEEYDSIPMERAAEKVQLASRWIRTDWQEFFKELREKRPIFKTPAFTFVTLFKDVQEVLSKEEIFSVRLYRSKMDPVVGGPFMLSRDNTEINWRERGIMQAMLQREELPAIREMSKEIAEEALDKFAVSGKIETVNELGRYVPVMMCGEYFGFPGPDREAMYRWSKAAQTNMFKNLPNDPQIQQAAEKAGEEMRTYLAELLKEKKAEIAKEAKEERRKKRRESRRFRIKKLLSKITHTEVPETASKSEEDDDLDDTFTRLIETHFSDEIHFDESRIISNMCGLLIGTVETTSQAIVQVIEQLLLNPAIFEGALKAAKADDNETFDKYVWEALRFNPINPLVFRYCEEDYVLAAGTERETLISKGTMVFACTSSAMFDAKELPEPERFSLERPDYHYMHFGYGHHICLGKYIGLVQIPEVVKQVILRPGVRLIPTPEGKIDFKGGPFPESFVIAYGDNMETQEKKVLETFLNYRKAFVKLQPEAAAPFFHEPAMFMSPQGFILMANEAEKLGVFSQIMQNLKARNYKYTELKNLNIKQLSDGMAMVNADGYRYKTDGEELERYTLTYTLRKVENDWKIIVAILHDIGTPPPYYAPLKL